MRDEPASPGLPDRQERVITVAFVVIGSLFLLAALYSAIGQWPDVQVAIEAAEQRPQSRVIMQELNREILAGFIGVVLFASGLLRWRE